MKSFSVASTLIFLLPIAAGLQLSFFNPQGQSSPLFTASAKDKVKKISDSKNPPDPEPPKIPTVPLPPTLTPVTQVKSSAPVNASMPRDMKLLVVAATGTEPSYQAVTAFLDFLGIPYQAVVRATGPLPELVTGGKGNYQGIVLATGNPALTTDEWTALDNYSRDYGVRTVAWYAWPEARYGLAWSGGAGSADAAAGVPMSFASASANVFPYLNRSKTLSVRSAYYYLAKATPAAGETTTPLLTIAGQVVGATHTKADGREYMAFTFDSNPYLIHSLAIQYGAFNWVTKGVFLGARKAYFSPQNDDHFLENDLFKAGVAACMPSGFTNEPTYYAGDVCKTDRMDKDDLKKMGEWQDKWNKTAQYAKFQLAMAFNGTGTSILYGGSEWKKDDLMTESIKQKTNFYWINHTYDHEDLDCFNPVPNSQVCKPATLAQSRAEIIANRLVAWLSGLPLDTAAMVTPGISGLDNPSFLQAARENGIRYLAADMSRPEGLPAAPNTGIRSTIEPSILMVPRRATSIYYNTKTTKLGADGSLPDEYNYFYGPGGLFKLNGQDWYSKAQTWAQILDRESDNLLIYMLRGEIYPVMFHQSNMIRYSGDSSLYSELVDATFAKFTAVTSLPVLSLSHSDVGKAMEARMAVNAAQVSATLYPGLKIELTGQGAAAVPVTGICKTACESYAGQSISQIPITAGRVTTISLP